MNPIGPRACYDEGKRVAETMCFAYKKQVLILSDIVKARVFPTYDWFRLILMVFCLLFYSTYAALAHVIEYSSSFFAVSKWDSTYPV